MLSLVTVTTQVALNEPTVATTLVVPSVKPITSPLLTVATAGFEEVQVTVPSAPFGRIVAVSIVVSPFSIDTLASLMVMPVTSTVFSHALNNTITALARNKNFFSFMIIKILSVYDRFILKVIQIQLFMDSDP
jgi:hypothetical protein